MASKKPDRLNVVMPDSQRTEEFKRPDHYDFMDSTELREAKWSGVRHNSLTHRMELWIVGEMKRDFLPSEQEAMIKYIADECGISQDLVAWDNQGGN